MKNDKLRNIYFNNVKSGKHTSKTKEEYKTLLIEKKAKQDEISHHSQKKDEVVQWENQLNLSQN